MGGPLPLALALALLLASGSSAPVKYDTAPKRDGGKITAHLVPHTHDDPGWLKTFDQYTFGIKQHIQSAGVIYVLETVVRALLEDVNRKFVYGEMSYFSKWWSLQSDERKDEVKYLIERGQLEFVNGGWVQHDEAAAHYVAMIDQTTQGHRFLKEEFNITPRIGWQLDPFGHSATHASLMSAGAGFDALFFARIDYQDRYVRNNNSEIEMVWRASPSFGVDADIFTGALARGHYSAPPGFGWEWGQWMQDGIVDDESSPEYNMPNRVEDFVNLVLAYANYSQGNNVLILMGNDFAYADSWSWFLNIDKLIHYVNKDGRIRVQYSTPTEYVEEKHSEDLTWTVKTDDFFPYADHEHCYWTGYFTSRPTSKSYIRHATSYLQAARQLEAVVGYASHGPNTGSLESAVSLAQHHDSITGTAKAHVAQDYHRRLSMGLEESGKLAMSVLWQLASGKLRDQGRPLWRPQEGEQNIARALLQQDRNQESKRALTQTTQSWSGPFEDCLLLNASICPTSVLASAKLRNMYVVAYNSLGWPRKETIRVPLSPGAGRAWAVKGTNGTLLESQVVDVSNITTRLQGILLDTNHTLSNASDGSHELVFMGEIPPMGFSMFTVCPMLLNNGEGTGTPRNVQEASAQHHGGSERGGQGTTDAAESRSDQEQVGADAPHRAGHSEPSACTDDCSQGVYPLSKMPKAAKGVVALDNGLLRINFNKHTGRLVSIENPEAGYGIKAGHSLDWYHSFYNKSEAGMNSGAYLFHPRNKSALLQRGTEVQTRHIQGRVVSEVVQEYSSWASLTWRLWSGERHVEMEWTVGPIPINDNVGKEVVSTFNTSLPSGNEFYTDSNGREMVRRVKDFRPTWTLNVTDPIAGNYYPITAAACIRHKPSNGSDGVYQPGFEFAVVTDRAQGAASLNSGALEVMLHRRILHDDFRGVGEALNETMCGCRNCDCVGLVARGVHYITFQPDNRSARIRRHLQQRLNDPLLLGFGHGPPNRFPGITSWSALQEGQSLPANVHLLTLQDMGVASGTQTLLRLAHMFQVDEDEELSSPAEVDLGSLFPGCSMEELTISANQPVRGVDRLRWKTAGGAAPPGTSTDDEHAVVRKVLELHPSVGCASQSCFTLKPMQILTLLVTCP
ncbi:unnamed protein product [Ostreobium quekettii]|uniref:Alpha-mannosidase n=1 Tax=Ostreobium quekettii TaxID=121088 RepID=A0A8S1J0B3_9CHLO|nr:unnamed protein product [Ostreobium quekettii]|eukprot:evm.model.scf_199.10 EVM.evm.TU.scf_199.10   scf_199:69943-85107(+)